MDHDRNRLTPRYYLIFEELGKQIEEGKYPVGTKFPSETELCKTYQVSRGTVRESLRMLIQQGILSREQGRGTYVIGKKQKIAQNAQRLMGFTELMKRYNKKPSAKILKLKTVKPDKKIQTLLELKDSEKVVEIDRLRFGDDEPLIIERSHYVYGYFYPLLEFDLEKESIYDMLHRETGLHLGDARQTIEAVSAAPADAVLLNVRPGDALLLIKRLIKIKDGRFIQYSEDLYRSDKLNFTIRTSDYDRHRFSVDMQS